MSKINTSESLMESSLATAQSSRSIPASFGLLKELQSAGGLRAIDVQFGLFIYQQQCRASRDQDNSVHELAEHIGVLACLLSYEFGLGHICIDVNKVSIHEMLSLKYWLKIHSKWSDKYATTLMQWQQLDWKAICLKSDLVANANGSTAQPLVLDGDRVYMTRYWHYEMKVAAGFLQRAKPVLYSSDKKQAMRNTLDRLFAREYSYLWMALSQIDLDNIQDRRRAMCESLDVEITDNLNWTEIDNALASARCVNDLALLDSLVPMSACLNWQKVAAAVALTRQFSVISGGPGTGKTTTVAKLLAALVTQSQDEATTPIIKLVAPTGKAAARLTESIGLAIDQLPVDPNIKAKMPRQSSTIHKLLGARANTVQLKHNRLNPLHVDILVVDEASMVDLPMMHRLLDALPKHARLILLGDKDQLASVEAGAILGDICSLSQTEYQAEYAKQLIDITGFQSFQSSTKSNDIADSLCMLRKSYRFHARSGIGKLAKAINEGDVAQVSATWLQGFNDIHLHPLIAPNLQTPQELETAQAELLGLMVEGYRPYCETIRLIKSALSQFHAEQAQADLFADIDVEPLSKAQMEEKAKQVLKAFSQTRLLCAVREGEHGVEGMNRAIEHALTQKKHISPKPGELWYEGRPIMISHNDSALGLHNGDIGICLSDLSEEDPRSRVYFEMPDGRIKGVLPSRVPQHETAFAMTIHKSQGSEFAHTVLLLPPKMNRILTRELIYTGVTRAKSRLDLFANPHVLAQGVSIKTLRTSGLSEKLNQIVRD
ncbi:exodeoxyribonuclease V subunit alpha [Vibrio rumoiensis]|uniref:RecBCD enzyme subunit RecD n=1 Tax=Vibrio rumoiensis 1S-45 TaxID=1188252 RepID=A0A1E5E3G0_9VIBR|nr:exodeoxyribonuclease V subunit alpha [Vibrio rumoiensis]OEF25875.1 exodeoxyribonuclease V subunit alpha [Vibrio rumoiensis 1S-45]